MIYDIKQPFCFAISYADWATFQDLATLPEQALTLPDNIIMQFGKTPIPQTSLSCGSIQEQTMHRLQVLTGTILASSKKSPYKHTMRLDYAKAASCQV